MSSNMPKNKSPYIFLKLQVVVLCGVAVWVLYSPPTLESMKIIVGKQNKSALIFTNGQTLLHSVSWRRRADFGAEERSFTVNSSRTSPLGGRSGVLEREGWDNVVDDHLTDETTSEVPDWLLHDESEEDDPSGNHKWIIKWEDRDFENTDRLPLSQEESVAEQQGGATGGVRQADRVVFNRVGKCGSRSVLNLLNRLATANHFYLLSSQTFNQKHINREKEDKLVSILSRMNVPFIYQRHLHFINFTKHGRPAPTYINIIRDPLERAVSQYYFIRFGDEKKQERKFSQNSTDPNKYMSYEECVQQRLTECVGKKAFYIIPFFCGQDKRCTYPSQWAYRRAKQNVERSYAAVGVLEELHDTLRVFEKVLPETFRGALQTYLRLEQLEHAHKSSVGVTNHKQRPSEEVARYVRGVVMRYEYLFYDWVRDRLHRQMEALGVAPLHHRHDDDDDDHR